LNIAADADVAAALGTGGVDLGTDEADLVAQEGDVAANLGIGVWGVGCGVWGRDVKLARNDRGAGVGGHGESGSGETDSAVGIDRDAARVTQIRLSQQCRQR